MVLCGVPPAVPLVGGRSGVGTRRTNLTVADVDLVVRRSAPYSLSQLSGLDCNTAPVDLNRNADDGIRPMNRRRSRSMAPSPRTNEYTL